VVVWSILRELGRAGVVARIERDNDHARRLAKLVQASGSLELLRAPVLSVCCFRYVADGVSDLDALNAAILERLYLETPYLPSSTKVDGVFALRACFINARTTTDLVDGLAAAVERVGHELRADFVCRL
jgi:aromatic-L-amino-acid decarboxylase